MGSNQSTPLTEDEDEAFLRRISFPEEYIIRYHPSLRGGFYRWFASKNVIDLVRERRRRSEARAESTFHRSF
jgi:hypothetical protein